MRMKEMTTYADFLASKAFVAPSAGIDPGDLNSMLYPFQRDITRWALRKRRAAVFADCGLGKTPMQLEWAKHIPGPVLIVAPLAVAEQTVREGEKFGVPVTYARDRVIEPEGIWITNYEMLEHFYPEDFAGIVLDESSIIKNKDGAFRRYLTEAWASVPYKLSCTATPAPNDYMELGTQCEFLGVMKASEMLAMFFCHDGGRTSQWRLKGHARHDFWRWLCSWAVMVRKPSDIGGDDTGFDLPPLTVRDHVVAATTVPDGYLFPMEASTLTERRAARRDTIQDRVAKCAELANNSDEAWVVWCNLNSESEALAKAIPDAVEVRGSDSIDHKRDTLLGFTSGTPRVLITKPTIAGHGMNWQHCRNMAFVGLSDSWEQYYQATRRCWRFMQEREVHVHVITADTEGAVVANIRRKEQEANEMAKGMVEHMREGMAKELEGTERTGAEHDIEVVRQDDWTMHLGDCVDVVSALDTGSIDYSIFSPPFASLYTYTDMDRDMGNCKDDAEFAEHFGFLVRELYRVIRPGRLVSFHCMNLPTVKAREGVIGLRDFRGDLIRLFQSHRFIYHSEVCIWKDPVTAMQRTKALGLLHKQIKKDAAMCRQGIADYLVTMRKPGENPQPVTNTNETFPVQVWQRYASPVWSDINPSDTLQFRSAREHDDERHICPLQLQVIRRAVRLWTNEGDLVLSPFAGIGSEGYVALEMRRRFVGTEIKRSYFGQACRNLEAAVASRADLFSQPEAD